MRKCFFRRYWKVGNWGATIGNLRGNASAGEEEEHSLADTCSFVALRVDPLDDDALGFRDSLSFFFVLLDMSRRRLKEWSDCTDVIAPIMMQKHVIDFNATFSKRRHRTCYGLLSVYFCVLVLDDSKILDFLCDSLSYRFLI